MLSCFYQAYHLRALGGEAWAYPLFKRGEAVGASFADWRWYCNSARAHQLAEWEVCAHSIIYHEDATASSQPWCDLVFVIMAHRNFRTKKGANSGHLRTSFGCFSAGTELCTEGIA